ncbi:MAG TPA: Mur ligase family protein, partial [Spirochaetota bacterium]|nr:Mur ligase family protein [Spirochaetota bacterium]
SPTAVIGGKWRNIGSNAELGQSRYLVCEADESDGSFLKLSPVISIVTNIDSDHMDYYKTEANLRLNFLTFINKTPFYGKAIICIDDPVLTEMLAEIKKPYITYGFSSQADIRAYDVKAVAQGMQYKVRAHNRELGVFQLNIPGEHNVLNSLAAVAAGMELDINVNTIQNSLREFQGVNRRMQFKGKWRNFRVMDDYAHHPTEIKATLKALKKQAARLVVIFQPHRYSRTLALHAEFARSFTDVDELYLMDIFPAGEKTLPGVSSALIYEKCRAPANIHYCSDRKQLVDKLKTANRDHSGIILTIGAGDVHKMADLIMN